MSTEATARVYYDFSGQIAVAGVAQIVWPFNRSRQGFMVVNNSAYTLWLGLAGATSAATDKGIALDPGDMYYHPQDMLPPAGDIVIFGQNLGQKFTFWGY